MFDEIVESVLNEISAEDAYNKFYKTLPRDAFFNLVNSYGKFDNLMKFLMNSISANKNRFEDAMNFVKLYKSAKNEVRIAFIKDFKDGKYDDITDMIYALNNFNENGVETQRKIQNNGLVVVSDDEDYRVTYTTTYEANHHYYGTSKWCTASDRLGRYDGWMYFLSYILGIGYGEVEDEYDYLDQYGVENCLIQITDKKKNQICQFQVDRYADVGESCDFSDMHISIYNTPYMDIIQNMLKNGTLGTAVDETSKSFKTEYKYQRKKDEYIIPKREKIARMIEEMEEQLKQQSISLAENKKHFIEQKASTAFNSNLLEDPSFIEKIIRLSSSFKEEGTEEEMQQYEKELQSVCYLSLNDSDQINEHIFSIKLTPIFGLVKDIKYGQNGMPTLGNIFSTEFWHYELELGMQEVNLIVEGDFDENFGYSDDKNTKINKVLKVIKHNNDGKICTISTINEYEYFTNEEFDRDYVKIFEHDSIDSRKNVRSLFNVKFCKTIYVDFYPMREYIYGEYSFIFGDEGGILINNKTLEYIKLKNVSAVDNSTIGCSKLIGKRCCFYAGINENDGNLYLFTDTITKVGPIEENYYAVIPQDQVSYNSYSSKVPEYILIGNYGDDYKYKYVFKTRKIVKKRIKRGG